MTNNKNGKVKVIILANENPQDHLLWLKACEKKKKDIDFSIVDLTGYSWLKEIKSQKFDILLSRPPGVSSLFKQLYDERIYILASVLKYPVYPSLNEILIYENKRFLSYWLTANRIPHPETLVFYNKKEASDFLKNTKYPVVAKTNIGASGSGVKILSNIDKAGKYLEAAFSAKGGVSRRWGPNLSKGNLLKRGFHYLKKPTDIKNKISVYKKSKEEIQKGFVIFQEYIPHDFEWRVVAIGDSYFAHKKLKIAEKASGSTLKGYENPPVSLLDLVKEIMEKHGFLSQAVDIFETKDRKFLVNEMQCFFGQSDPYQMLVDGKPGRYRYIKNKWVFEEGMYNDNESYDLRLQNVLKILENKK